MIHLEKNLFFGRHNMSHLQHLYFLNVYYEFVKLHSPSFTMTLSNRTWWTTWVLSVQWIWTCLMSHNSLGRSLNYSHKSINTNIKYRKQFIYSNWQYFTCTLLTILMDVWKYVDSSAFVHVHINNYHFNEDCAKKQK